jgi:hypothetical protein
VCERTHTVAGPFKCAIASVALRAGVAVQASRRCYALVRRELSSLVRRTGTAGTGQPAQPAPKKNKHLPGPVRRPARAGRRLPRWAPNALMQRLTELTQPRRAICQHL